MKKFLAIISLIIGIFFTAMSVNADPVYFKDKLIIKGLESGFDLCHEDEVCEYKNVDLEMFNNGTEVIVKKDNNKYDLISKTFVTIVRDADEIVNIKSHFSEGVIRDIGVKKNDKYGIVRYNRDEETVEQLFPYEYDDLVLAPPNTFFLKKNDKWGLVQDGEVKINFIYDNVEQMGYDKDHRYYKTEIANLYGYIDVDTLDINDAEYLDVKLKKKGDNVFPQVKEKVIWHYPNKDVKKGVAQENRKKIKQGAIYALCLPIILPVLIVMF